MLGFSLHTLTRTPNLSRTERDEGRAQEKECLRFSKQLAVLIYLASRPQARASREELIGLLWENSSPHDARQALRQVVYQIRHGTGDLLTGDQVLVLRKSAVAFDVETFRAYLAAGKLRDAYGIYENDFLADVALSGAREFEHWTEGIRQQLAAEWRQLLRSLIAEAVDGGNWTDATDYAARLIERDPYDLEPRFKIVELLGLSGDQIRARAAAEEVRRVAAEIHGERMPTFLDEAITRALEPTAIPERRQYQGFPRHPELVGRAAEFHIVVDRWKRALSGQGGGVLISGEAGIGKTRLARDLQRRFQRDRCLVLQSSCYTIEQSDALGPFLEMLREAHAAPGLSAASPACLEVVAAVIPEIGSRFRDAIAPRRGPIPQQALITSLLDAFMAIAEELPLALIVEDLHQSRATTIEFVHRVARSARATHLLVMATARDVGGGEDISRALRDLTSTGAVAEVALSPLDVADIHHFIGSIAQLPVDQTGRDLARQVYERTAGVPFHVLELLKSLYDTGELQVCDGAWVFSQRLCDQSQPLPVPESANAILEQRLQTLEKTHLEVFAALAVWEREATVQDLAHLTGYDEAIVSAGIEALQRRRLIGGGPGMPAIVHEKLGAVALRAVPQGTLCRFHVRSSELAEQAALQGPTAEWSVAALHAGAAGDADRAARNAARAAVEVDRAMGRDAALEALDTMFEGTPQAIRDELEAALSRILAKQGSAKSWLDARGRRRRAAG